MATDLIRMNGAAFTRSSVLSKSLEDFVEFHMNTSVYERFGDKRTAMFNEVWNIAHGKKEVYKPSGITVPAIEPKIISVKKKKK